MKRILILAGAAALGIGLALPASAFENGDPGSEHLIVFDNEAVHLADFANDRGIAILPYEGAGEIIYVTQGDSLKDRVIEPTLLDKLVTEHWAIKTVAPEHVDTAFDIGLNDPFEGIYKDPIAGHISEIGTLERGAEKLKSFDRGFLPTLMT